MSHIPRSTADREALIPSSPVRAGGGRSSRLRELLTPPPAAQGGRAGAEQANDAHRNPGQGECRRGHQTDTLEASAEDAVVVAILTEALPDDHEVAGGVAGDRRIALVARGVRIDREFR